MLSNVSEGFFEVRDILGIKPLLCNANTEVPGNFPRERMSICFWQVRWSKNSSCGRRRGIELSQE